MSLKTIIKIMGWLSGKLVTEKARLEAQNAAMVKQIAAIEKLRIKHTIEISIANNMVKSINNWTAIPTPNKFNK